MHMHPCDTRRYQEKARYDKYYASLKEAEEE